MHNASMTVATTWAPTLLCALLALGCSKRSWDDDAVDPSLVEIDTAKYRIRTDILGSGNGPLSATFVLVSARNRSAHDLIVDIGGDLLSASGTSLAPLQADELRVPAGGERVFALVDKARKPRPGAKTAALRVVSARKVRYAPEVVITDGNVYLDSDRVVAAGYVKNTVADRPVRILVAAAFFDATGRPMTRPFTVIKLQGGQKQAARFVGPVGSAKGMLFVGQIAYD